jgi:hypothetical protein
VRDFHSLDSKSFGCRYFFAEEEPTQLGNIQEDRGEGVGVGRGGGCFLITA